MRASDVNVMWLGVRPEDTQPSFDLAKEDPWKNQGLASEYRKHHQCVRVVV
jgi:hypothetical protein